MPHGWWLHGVHEQRVLRRAVAGAGQVLRVWVLRHATLQHHVGVHSVRLSLRGSLPSRKVTYFLTFNHTLCVFQAGTRTSCNPTRYCRLCHMGHSGHRVLLDLQSPRSVFPGNGNQCARSQRLAIHGQSACPRWFAHCAFFVEYMRY